MYHAHFGLERALFDDGIAADAAVFRTARHDRLIAHFKLALGSPSAAVALRGPAGVGKTTLTSAALRMTSTRLALAWLGGAATNPAELLELILVELGINTVRTTRIERVQLWRQFQAEMRATESRLFLVVERTEDLSADVLHALDQLTAPDAAGNPGANLVLLGNEGLDAHLAAPVLDSLRQRIRLRGVLEPFTEAELQDYLRHQAACAGGSYDRIFAPGAAAALYRYSRGVARLANNLCESALDVAAVQQHKQVTSELVARTAVTLLGLQEPMPLARTASTAVAEPPKAPERPAVPRSAPIASAPTPASVATSVTASASVSTTAASASEPRATQAAPSLPSETNDAPPPRAEPVTAVLPAEPAVIRGVDSAPVTPAAPVTPPSLSAMLSPSLPPSAAAPASPPQPSAAAYTSAPASPLPSAAISASAPVSPPPSAATPASPPTASPPPVVSAAPAPARTVEPDVEFDGGATDVADVALVDFPVLTDAVEPPVAPAAPATPVAPKPAPSPPPPPASSRPAPPAASAPPLVASKPVAARASRIETAYTATRPPSPALAAAAPAAPPSAAPVASPSASAQFPAIPAKPAAAFAPANPNDDDELRQTQTMRAISVAKSIDDISSSMAETLFSDAELDLVTAALAAEWPDDEDEAAAAPAPAPEKPAAAQVLPVDDPFDLFGLGDDAPLELIDDSADPPKTASR